MRFPQLGVGIHFLIRNEPTPTQNPFKHVDREMCTSSAPTLSFFLRRIQTPGKKTQISAKVEALATLCILIKQSFA